VIDLHCHVLHGIDDGPPALEGSLAIARAAAAAGTRTLVATPHVSWRYQNGADTIAELVKGLNLALAAAGIALDVRPGAEIAMTRLPEIAPDELAELGYGGGRWLLIEPPFAAMASGLDLIVADLKRRGYRVVLAHPERCDALRRDPELLGSLVRSGVLTSITAGSLTGAFGETVRRFALALAGDGMVHNVASDAHDPVDRPPIIASAIEEAGLGPLAQWLTEEVPAAILADEDRMPRRPALALPGLTTSRPSWWRRVARGRVTRASRSR
jgi:protein-tyrosine phosphatase